MKATIVCVCGFMGTVTANTPEEAQPKFEARGWRYTRKATGENQENGFDLEGICQECLELSEED